MSTTIRRIQDIQGSRVFNKLPIFSLGGNANIVINLTNIIAKHLCPDSTTYSLNQEDAEKLTSFYIDAGYGATSKLGRLPDVNNMLVSKGSRFMISALDDEDIPDQGTLYQNKLRHATRLEIYSQDKDCNIKFRVNELPLNPLSTKAERSLKIEIINLPENGITLPRTVSDAIVQWLSYWFCTEAVERRLNNRHPSARNRNIDTVFTRSGKGVLSDVYTIRDAYWGDKVLVAAFENNSRFMVVYEEPDNPKSIAINLLGNDGLNTTFHGYGMTTDMTGAAICKRIEKRLTGYGYPQDYVIHYVRDVDAFSSVYDLWLNEISR